MTKLFKDSSDDTAKAPMEPARTLGEALDRIRLLKAASRKGYYGLGAFLVLTVAAILHMNLLPQLSEEVVARLGPAPPVKWINIALVIYTFSAIILILGRIMQGTNTYRGWSHLLYLGCFYAFYFVARGLQENFWAIFAAGLTILVLENYRLSLYCSEAISREQEVVDKAGREDKKRRDD